MFTFLKFTCFLCIFLIAVSVQAQEVLKEWKFQLKSNLNENIKYSYHGEDNKFVWSVDSVNKTPDGDNSLRITSLSVKPNSKMHEKQINFIYNANLNKEQKYMVEFWCKGREGKEISLTVAQAQAPYKALANPSSVNHKIVFTGKWQKVSVEFYPLQNWNCSVAAPRIMAAHYPARYSFHIGPVKFVKAPKHLALDISHEWKVFAGVNSNDLHIASFNEIPDSMLQSNGITVAHQTARLTENAIDIATLAGGFAFKNCAVLFNEFESAEEGQMQIGCSADWWMEFAVNGYVVFSTMQTGNISQVYKPGDHVFNFPVRKGKNLIAVKVLSGANGWKFVAGAVDFREKGSELIEMKANKDWKPLDYSNFRIKRGSALDLSEIVERKPAGTFGRVIINKAGKLAFENNPSQAARFFSFNGGMPWEAVSHECIDSFADEVASSGYNMVRLHYSHVTLLNNRRARTTLESPEQLPQVAEEIPFDSQKVDLFDYMVSAFKKRGIYINLDALAGHGGYSNNNPWWSKNKLMRPGYQLLIDEKFRNNWKAGVGFILTHYNKYIEGSLMDDPVLVNVCFYNEQDFHVNNEQFQQVLAPAWREYLENKYGSIEKLRKSWKDFPLVSNVKDFHVIPPPNEKMLRGGGASSHDAGDFLIGMMTEMTQWYYNTLKEIGYKGLSSQWDMIIRTMEIPARALMPVIAQHTYFCHPGTKKVNGKTHKTVGQSSSINSSYFRAAAAARFSDRPYLITEYSHSSFNRYRHERGLYFGAYAALQGWDSLAAHANMVKMIPEPLETFENPCDPISRASEVVTAFAWLRGDVKTSPHMVELLLKPQNLFPDFYLSAIGDDYAQLAMITGLGISYPSVKPLAPVGKASPDMTIIPETFSTLGVSSWYISAATSYGNEFPIVIKKLRKHGIISSANRTDPFARLYQSDTGEITLYGRDETMTVVTPRLEGAVIKKDKPVKLKNVSINRCSVPASVTIVSLNKLESIENSKRLLLVFSSNALNTGMIIRNGNTMEKQGELPVLMQTGKLELKIQSSNAKMKLYALSVDGNRREQLPLIITNGKIYMKLDTSKLKYATPFFELVSE